VSDQGDPLAGRIPTLRLEGGQRSLVQPHKDMVAEVGDRGAEVDPRAALLMAAIQLLMSLGQPLPGGEDFGSEAGHGQMAS
jgi:hypothetical protein